MRNRLITMFISFFLVLTLSPITIHAAKSTSTGGSSGLITLYVQIEGLASGVEAPLRVEKISDSVLTVYEGTSVNHVAIFKIPFGGTCTIIPGDVAGYATPQALTNISLTQLKGKLTLTKTVTYRQATIPVTGIEISPSSLYMIAGESYLFSKTISPTNASNQNVIWTSSNQTVASVTDGLVVALAKGVSIVSVRSSENPLISAMSIVNVAEIISLDNPPVLYANVGEVIELPTTVVAHLSLPDGSETIVNVPVNWNGVGASNAIVYADAGLKVLVGSVDASGLVVELNIIVTGSSIVEATDVELDYHTLGLYLDKSATLSIQSVIPVGASTAAVKWASTNEGVAVIVESDENTAVIKGVGVGTTMINVYIETSLGNLVLDTCIMNVSIDPTITDSVYIVATDEFSTVSVDQFPTKFDVFIRAYGLTPFEKYYILIEDKGTGQPLGSGEITPLDENIVFNLYEQTPFNDTTNFSVSYFVKMSKISTFPSGDYEDGTPKTVTDNFKITSPVPTGLIVVNVEEIINGSNQNLISMNLIGRDVILCREIKTQTALETQYEDYLNNPNASPALPLYTDEVKLIGHINPNGTVSWETPKESLKIGGYILLVDLPHGYVSNLDVVNPYTDDGTLLKEVHILRNKTVNRTILLMQP